MCRARWSPRGLWARARRGRGAGSRHCGISFTVASAISVAEMREGKEGEGRGTREGDRACHD